MNYNIYFDICAVVLFIVLIFLFFYKKNVPNMQNKIFFILLWMSLITTIVDIASACLISSRAVESEWLYWTLSYVYLILHNLTPIVYAIYIIALTDTQDKLFRSRQGIIFVFPLLIQIFIFAMNPVFKWLFYYDDNLNYIRGNAIYALYVIAVYYLIYGMIYSTVYKDIISKNKRIAVNSFIFISSVAVIFQMFFPELLIEMFGIAICMLLVSFTIQNPEELIDGMTELMNRNAFLTMATIDFRNNSHCYIITIRMRDIPFLSRTFGVIYINRILKKVSEYLYSYFLHIGRVYYIGEGEFTFFVMEKDRDRIEQWIKDIKERFELPWIYNKFEVQLTVQIMVIEYPNDADTIEAVLECIALMPEKKDDVFSASTLKNNIGKRKVDIDYAIQRALTNKSFQVYYQPIYSAKKGKIVSAEALIRLIDIDLGFISPEEFIPIAEQNGTILEIGIFVLESVCHFLKKNNLKEKGIEYIEVNLSVVQCMQSNLWDQIMQIIEKYEISTDQINLEITETAAAYSPEALELNMRKLSERGVRFSLDDYGTGYSNMTYMVELPFHIVKLDKSIVWSAMENKKAQIAMVSTIAMLKQLKLEIVAEGVETEEQMDILLRQGCNYLQGYYFSKPVPENQFLEVTNNL